MHPPTPAQYSQVCCLYSWLFTRLDMYISSKQQHLTPAHGGVMCAGNVPRARRLKTQAQLKTKKKPMLLS